MKTVGISIDILDRLDDLAREITTATDSHARHRALRRFRTVTATLRGLTATDTYNRDTSSHVTIDIPHDGMV